MASIANYRRHVFWVLFSATAGVTGAFIACTDSYRGDSPNGSGLNSSGSGQGGNNSDAGGIFGGGGMCQPTCSNDLKKVVNCLGTVMEECTPDEGCVNAECIPDPCEAARRSKSSYGCDYWALKPAQRPEATGACFAAFVANTWSKAVHLGVQRGGGSLTVSSLAYIPQVQGGTVTYTPYDDAPDKGLAVGEVAILFLSRGAG